MISNPPWVHSEKEWTEMMQEDLDYIFLPSTINRIIKYYSNFGWSKYDKRYLMFNKEHNRGKS